MEGAECMCRREGEGLVRYRVWIMVRKCELGGWSRGEQLTRKHLLSWFSQAGGDKGRLEKGGISEAARVW